MAIWDFNDEQANLLDVLDMAEASDPQRIKRGERRLYVVSEEDWLAAKGLPNAEENVLPIRKTKGTIAAYTVMHIQNAGARREDFAED